MSGLREDDQVNPLEIGSSTVRRMRELVDSLRRQAPGARMVGEFAVRLASKDVARRLGLSQQSTRPAGEASAVREEPGPDEVDGHEDPGKP